MSCLSKADAAHDEPFIRLLERSGLEEETKRGIAMYVEGFNAASKDRIGVVGLKHQQEAENAVEGDRIFRTLDGYDAVPLSLYRLLRDPDQTVRLNTVVRSVRWRAGNVELDCARGGEGLAGLEAECAVVTVPLSLLQSTADADPSIRFNPELPGIRDAAARLAMGSAVRVTLRFRTTFWEQDEAFENASFVFAPGLALPTWWTQLPVRSPVVTGWAGGPPADEFPPADRALACAIDSMSSAFRTPRSRVVEELAAWRFHDWRSDPFARGAYSYVPASSLDAIETLGRPVDKTLFFAGEATDAGGRWGTVHGALRSAERAVGQVLESR